MQYTVDYSSARSADLQHRWSRGTLTESDSACSIPENLRGEISSSYEVAEPVLVVDKGLYGLLPQANVSPGDIRQASKCSLIAPLHYCQPNL